MVSSASHTIVNQRNNLCEMRTSRLRYRRARIRSGTKRRKVNAANNTILNLTSELRVRRKLFHADCGRFGDRAFRAKADQDRRKEIVNQ